MVAGLVVGFASLVEHGAGLNTFQVGAWHCRALRQMGSRLTPQTTSGFIRLTPPPIEAHRDLHKCPLEPPVGHGFPARQFAPAERPIPDLPG
jgi:hypothetical protein